jgi:hypothetical protein
MADLGSVSATAAAATPEALRTFLKSEIDLWGMVIKQAGVAPRVARVSLLKNFPLPGSRASLVASASCACSST